MVSNCLVLKVWKKNMVHKFLVISLNWSPILGLESCEELGLIQRLNNIKSRNNSYKNPDELASQFFDVFTGIGCLNCTVKIKLKEIYIPHTAVPRKITFSLHDKIKHELQCMIESGIITKVDKLTKWINNRY